MFRNINRSVKASLSVALIVAMISGCGSSSSSNDDTGTPQPKNVFLMVSDGTSFGAWDAAALLQYGSATGADYFDPEFSKYLMSVYPLNTSSVPTGGLTEEVSYDPDQAWGLASYNAPNSYIHQNYTDSAAAGTALSTGRKTYNNAMNWSNDPATTGSELVPTIAELAKENGKVVGTISSVQWSHATPAALSNAHNVSRNNYAEIANMILDGDVVDVIMGAGHPQWDNNGTQLYADYNDLAIDDARARFVGGRNTWIQLKEGTHTGDLALIETADDFAALAQGDLSVLDGRSRVVGTAQVGSTLQQSRSGYAVTDTPYSDPFNTNVPSLQTMTKAALSVLSQLDQGEGIFLHIEGGAVDWAAHGNQTSRIIEEQADFNLAVAAVTDWIEANGGWEENLLIILTDHGNSMPMGPASDTVPHARISLNDIFGGQYTTDNQQGVRWWSGTHTNELVPLFARGIGADYFADLVDGTDSNFCVYYADWCDTGYDGRFVDNTDVYSVMERAVGGAQ